MEMGNPSPNPGIGSEPITLNKVLICIFIFGLGVLTGVVGYKFTRKQLDVAKDEGKKEAMNSPQTK